MWVMQIRISIRYAEVPPSGNAFKNIRRIQKHSDNRIGRQKIPTAPVLEIAATYSDASSIHLLLENLSPHTRKAVVDRLGEAPGTGSGTASGSVTRPNTEVGCASLNS
jgi:hypothetical protein